jgi:hypothetical protein
MEEGRETFPVAVRFSCGRSISPELREIKFDKYRITTLPSKRDLLRPSKEDALLEFQDVWEKDQRASNPEKEAQYLLAWISLMFGATVDFDSTKVNNVNVTAQIRGKGPRPDPITSVSDLNLLFQNLCALDEKGARQYLRACEAYRVAVSLLSENSTLAMFMLVTSVECLSNSFERRKCLHLRRAGSGNYDRFRDFILSNLPVDLEAEKSDRMFPELLKRCYAIRSAFTHGGKPLSLAAGLADQVEKKFVRHFEDGRQVVTPSLAWFENLVRSVLIEFSRRRSGERQASLARLALEEGTLMLRAKRSVKLGQIMTREDVEL